MRTQPRLILALLFVAGLIHSGVSLAQSNPAVQCELNYLTAALQERFAYANKVAVSENSHLAGAIFVSLSDAQRAVEEAPEKIIPPLSFSARWFFNKHTSPLLNEFNQGNMSALYKYGPNGRKIWNPSTWISSIDFREESKLMTLEGGPMSDQGSLFELGSTGYDQYHYVLPLMGPYGKAMQDGGIFFFAGPKSANGPDGPLGALSAIGGHGYQADPVTGEFKNADGKVVHYILLTGLNGVKRWFPLLPTLAPRHVMKLSANRLLRPPFVVDHWLEKDHSVRTYTMKVARNTVPEFRVISDTFSNRFSVEILSNDGKLIAKSDSTDFSTNIIQMKPPRGAEIKVRIRYLGDIHKRWDEAINPRLKYRLITTAALSDVGEDLGFDGPHMTVAVPRP